MIPNSILRNESISREARLVYCLIASFNPSYPSYTHLQKLSAYSRAIIARAIKELYTLKLIDIIRDSGKNNQYRICTSSAVVAVTSSQDELVNAKMGVTSSQDELVLVHQVNSNNTNIKNTNNTCIVENKTQELEPKKIEDLNSQTSDLFDLRSETQTQTQPSQPEPSPPKTGAAPPSPKLVKSEFDFDSIYSAYPKRDGNTMKSKGLKTLKSKIRTQAQFDSMLRAVKNYRDECSAKNRTGTEYVMQFSRFVSSVWEEYLEVEIKKPKLVLLTTSEELFN